MKSNFRRKFKVGQMVIYRKPKSSTSPGQRAINVRPSSRGESYVYEVEKYWEVSKIIDDERIELSTRTGKRHVVSTDDKRLRPATWLDRFFSGDRFPKQDVISDSSVA